MKGGEIVDINNYMTVSEAAERYGVKLETLKYHLKPSSPNEDKRKEWIEKGLIRQSGSTWILTTKFMEQNFPKK